MDNLTEHFNGIGGLILHNLQKVMHFIIIISGCIMALTFFSVVILRYGFNANLFAYEEWLMVIAFWMFFMASAVATHNRAHICADILGVFIKKPTTMWVRTLTVKLIELVILCYLSYLGVSMIIEEIAVYPMWQMSIALKIPFIVPRLAICLGFTMMTVYTALYIYILLSEGASHFSHIEKNTAKEQ